MASVCTTNDFDTDDNGRLKVSLCGDPADAEFDSTCDTNGLKRDPDCGLWIANPQIRTRLILDSGIRQVGRSIDPGEVEQDRIDTALTNDECRPVHHVALVSFQFTIRIPGNGGGVEIASGFGLSPNNRTGDTIYNDGPATRSYGIRLINQNAFVSPAGAAQTLTTIARVRNVGVGTVLWQNVEHEINMQSITEGS